MAESNLKFAEEGLKIEASIAEEMETLMTAGATIAVSAPGVGTIIGAAVFVIGLINALGSNDVEIAKALDQLQKEIKEIAFALTVLDERLTNLIEQNAILDNRQTLRDLLDYLDDFRNLENDLIDHPNDLETAVRVANHAGINIDKFLRNDFEIWRWTDVVLEESFDPTTGQTRQFNALSVLRFKNIPTLPVYITGLMTWLAAREKVVNAGQKSRLLDDQARLERHRAATAVRPNFHKYRTGIDGTPQSIAEHIKSRIVAYVVASTPYPQNQVCQFYFVVGSMMTGKSQAELPGFDLIVERDADTCFINSDELGPPAMEIDLETKAGVDTLYELTELLARLASGGSLGPQPPLGVFSTTEVFTPATLYVIDQAGDLQWYRNESANQRGGSKAWIGPKRIGNGWGGYTKVFNGGGSAIYGIKPNGDLMWYGHDGFADGTPRWRGAPNRVGHGWDGFKHVFSGGEYVVYAIQPDGRVFWYRHDGAPSGGDESTWEGKKEIASGWQVFDKVFSGGGGILYGIRPDGVLERRRHKGYLNGTPDWEKPEEIGSGWQDFRDVVSANGVIYAFTRDGRILWYRYAKRRPPLPGSNIPTGGIEALPADAEVWEGSVEIKRNFPAFRSVFPLMGAPWIPPN